jgi:FlaA1/EpsC-like NDP-sugar epimerase
MTIPEAVHLILQSWVMGVNDDLFVLDMGEPVKIYDLAKLLIILQGYIPGEDIKIKITGLRPGEKLYEEVLIDEEKTKSTAVKKIFRTKSFHDFNQVSFLFQLDELVDSLELEDLKTDNLKQRLKEMVSTYKPKE